MNRPQYFIDRSRLCKPLCVFLFAMAFTFMSAALTPDPALAMGFFGGKDKEEESKKPVRRKPRPKKPEVKTVVTGAEIVRYGIYDAEVDQVIEPEKKDGKKGKKEDKTEESGVLPDIEYMEGSTANIKLKKYQLKEQTNTIPSKRGVFFGFEYKLIGKPEGKEVDLIIKDRITTKADPSSDIPNTFASVTQEKGKIGETNLVAFEFKEREDLFSGEWKFTIIHNGNTLTEKAFVIEEPKPETVPEPEIPGMKDPEAKDGEPNPETEKAP